jgi:hypothetical protein
MHPGQSNMEIMPCLHPLPKAVAMLLSCLPNPFNKDNDEDESVMNR